MVNLKCWVRAWTEPYEQCGPLKSLKGQRYNDEGIRWERTLCSQSLHRLEG